MVDFRKLINNYCTTSKSKHVAWMKIVDINKKENHWDEVMTYIKARPDTSMNKFILLGRMFEYGYSVRKNLHEAIKYYIKAQQVGYKNSFPHICKACSKLEDQQEAMKIISETINPNSMKRINSHLKKIISNDKTLIDFIFKFNQLKKENLRLKTEKMLIPSDDPDVKYVVHI